MPLAAPLILPFAELAGITIAGLGMAAASKKVSDFISDNPETSTQILTMLVPGGQGLNALFKKKASVTLEDVEDMTDEEAADLSKEDKAEIMKEVGKSKGGDKRQRMIEISEKLGLSGEGKEKQTIIDEVEERYDEGGVEDAPKPKFDYKKFFRNRNADGGAIGIEVLFEEKKDGGRIGFANGGDNIIGSTIDKFFSGPAMDTYTKDYMESVKAPSTFDYNIASNKAAGQFIQDKTKELLGDNPVSNVVGQAATYAGVPLSIMASPFYETAQIISDKRMEPGSGVKGFYDAFMDERPFSTAIERGAGVLQSTPLGEAIYNLGGKAADLVSGIRNTNIGDFFFAPAGAADFQGGEMLQTPGVMVDANEGFRTPTRTNVQGRDLEADLGTRINPDIQPSLNMFQRAGNFIGELDLEDYLPFVGEKSLTRMLGQGVGNLFRGIAPARYGTSQRVYNALSPQGRSAVGNIYGPGGIMKGYNPVSAFGRGAIGAINNRISNIQNRRAPQTYASQQKIKDLFEARNKIAGTSMEGRTYTGFGKTGMGRDTDVQMSGKAPSRGRDRDVQMSGSSSGGGGGGKIVCTMMNESYGFGNFRNKIWLKHSRDLPKEYEIGYHTIFLPLVKFAKGEGKLNKVVKKTLEHIARHRTIDLKKEMKGKIHTLGRVYRKILEPICLMVGKIKKAVK